MDIRVQRKLVRAIAVVSALLLVSSDLQAQFLGLDLRGDVGLKSGTQSPPGVYLTLPLYYGNDFDGLRDASGNTIAEGLDVDLHVLTVPAFALTTKEKVFGGTLGLSAVLEFTGARASIAQHGITERQGYGLSDTYVVPFSLGWWTPRADYKVAYAFVAPTGTDGRSLDMWAHEISAGSTVYFDDQQLWHFAATGFYEIHQNKRGQDLRVGDILTIEGGLGGSFLKGDASAGIAYVAQWKITNDSGDDFPALLPKSKSRVFGVGPELNMPVFGAGTLAGLLSARYLWEFGGRSIFEGQTFVASFTVARLNAS
jgi:hypothetical protein